MLANTAYPVRLPAFEGPLDLLLFLIRKQEIDIYDIPIEMVTKQYLKILYEMEQLQLDVAGEFFVMAATLMEIKSRMLLPKAIQTTDPNADDEEFDPRWELVHQLLEYQRFKQAGQDIDRLMRQQRDLLPRVVPASKAVAVERPLQPVDKLDLWHTFNQVLRRLSEKLVVGEIHDEPVSVAERMEYLLEITGAGETRSFSSLFDNETPATVKLVISTFLGVLELVRLRRIKVWQDESFSEIFFSGCGENELENDAEPTEGDLDGQNQES